MLWIELTHNIIAWAVDAGASMPGEWLQGTLWHHLHLDWSTLATGFNTDVFAGFRAAVDNFVKSGQLWALLIGIFIGYVIRGITTYN